MEAFSGFSMYSYNLRPHHHHILEPDVHIDELTPEQLQQQAEQLEQRYTAFAEQGLKLDLTRGKPCTEQVALSNALDGILQGDFTDTDGTDVRNYGGLTGIASARELFSDVLDVGLEQTLVGGNSSLSLMYLVMEYAMNSGLAGAPWRDQGAVKFLCPVPGYDRHFALTEYLGIEMVNVPMLNTGPDMDQVEAMVSADASIKGIWCVPRFSNPTGCVYASDTVERIARLGQMTPDFLVMWDNAYAVHTLREGAEILAPIARYCEQHGTENNVVQFGSTSKVTFAGAGVAFLASGDSNIGKLSSHIGYSTIGPDKVNQLRHVRLLQDRDGLEAHMRQHAAIIQPRFKAVLDALEAGLAGTGMGEWTTPGGGYFISFESRDGLATEIVKLASDIGVKLTPAGATYPYNKDPKDSNIRLAPTFPSLEDVEATADAFVLCVKLASVRQKIAKG